LIEVEVEDEAWLGAMPDVEALAERAAIAALANGVESDAASGIVILLLLGYDHTDDADAERMESLERVILAGLGIADPYAAEQDDHG
jgi:hypothetical protein